MQIRNLVLLLLLAPMANAVTLTSITLLPPSDGYHINPNGGSLQMTPQCGYDNGTTDNCSTQTLTWGSSDPVDLSVNASTGLATMGTSVGGGIASVVRSGNVVTVTLTGTQSNFIKNGNLIIVTGVTDSSFNGTFTISNDPSSNSFTYSQTAANASSSGGKVYLVNTPDVYAYTGTVLGHHVLMMDYYTITDLTSRPETTSFNVVVGTTVLVSAAANVSVQNDPVGNYCAYTTSDATKATVNNLGEVLGIAPGTVDITCTLGTHSVARTLTVFSPTLQNKVWYVRPDGGTRYDAAVPSGQCSGLVNAAYPGSGTNQACAFSNPMYCITDESSSSVYTGAMQGGDMCVIAPTATLAGYPMNGKSSSVNWVVGGPIPSGTPGQHTKILGSNYASCSSASSRTKLQNYYAGGNAIFDLRGSQNVDISCIAMSNFEDCNSRLSTYFNFPCYSDQQTYGLIIDNFTANFNLFNSSLQDFFYGVTGTDGPGFNIENSDISMNYAAGLSFDATFGAQGNRADGFTQSGTTIAYNGCTKEVPKTLASVSRDGAGSLTATFNASQMVNYVTGTNLVLTGMTPSDLNGTFPVSSVTFNQKTVSITGASCVTNPNSFGGVFTCSITTTTAPAFGTGEFVNITGVTPAWMNGAYEVYSTDGTGFVVIGSAITRPGWTTGTFTTSGSASTAVTVVASAAGSSESASVVGTASHVIPAHRCLDQGSGGYGDGVGTGVGTIGSFTSDKNTFTDNLQDGWDMLHSAMVNSSFTNNMASGNEGAAAKFGNADTGSFYNNYLVTNCNVLLAFNPDKPPDFNQYLSLNCRSGDATPVGTRAWSRYGISNNTWESTFGIFVDDTCNDRVGCAALPTLSNFTMQNNVFLGFVDSNGPGFNGSQPTIYCGGTCNNSWTDNAVWTWANNMAFNTRNPPSGGTNNQWATDPLVVAKIPDISTFSGETASLTWNMNLTASSPAIGAGIQNTYVPTTDYNDYTRPNPPSIGALEFQTPSPFTFTTGGSIVLSGGVRF